MTVAPNRPEVSARNNDTTVTIERTAAQVQRPRHWRVAPTRPFTREERDHTTIWMAGLSRNHDLLVCAAARGLGYRMEALPVPDNEALTLGKEFGNRGQCNPTYYTSGNLLKSLQALEAGGMSRDQIIDKYVYLTAAACGPCRFGMYVSEYRKALTEAGFEGFRVIRFLQETAGGADPDDCGVDFTPGFFLSLIRAILAADVLNVMTYRIRPYERIFGSTDAAVRKCQDILIEALEGRRSVLAALRRCRRVLRDVDVDRLQIRPMVSIIGEFWGDDHRGRRKLSVTALSRRTRRRGHDPTSVGSHSVPYLGESARSRASYIPARGRITGCGDCGRKIRGANRCFSRLLARCCG